VVSASDIARQILSAMWEYGRLILIIVVVLAVWGTFLDRFEDENERSGITGAHVRIGLAIVGTFVLFSFLNVATANIIILMRVRPAWGLFTCLVAILVASVVVKIAYRQLTERRKEPVISVVESSEESTRVLFTTGIKLTCVSLALLAITDIVWLWQIGN
jgi:Na+/H+-translocating membrane pyrophosphatase